VEAPDGIMTRSRNLGPKLFTLDQAEALLPFVQERLARIQEIQARFEACRRDISVLRLVSASGGDESNPDVREYSRLRTLEKSLLEEIESLHEEVAESGCLPKSFQQGLIDFFALKDGRLVFLCWKQGERGIRAWHTLEGGFRGRMSIASFLAEGFALPNPEEEP
jgi:hypothetical protein